MQFTRANFRNKKTNKKRKTINKVVRMVFMVIGAILFLWFLAPFLTAGILNIGNMTGMILSVMLMLYIGFMPSINRFLKAGWKRVKVRRFMAFLGSIIALCAILVAVETGCMIGACAKAPAEDATAIVLGCRVYGARASLMLRERLDAAVEYLEDNPKAACVVSGGQGNGENISEAECMYRYLVEKGIEPERIYKEDMSTSTEENIEFSVEIIKENDLNENVVIITNEFHMYRAGILAKNQGLSYGSAPAGTAIWLFPTYYIRELYAILAEWAF